LVQILTIDAPSITSVRRTVPPHVESALAQALEKLPADRFENAADFASALGDESFTYRAQPRTPIATQEPVAVPSPVAAARPWHQDRRVVGSLVGGVVLGALAAWGWLGPPPLVEPDYPTRSLVDIGDIELGPTD
jgi:serine/threonine-protein kinase